jgi:L-rhamnose mutarotase
MERIAFKMLLKPGNAEEYCRRHDAIWPELVALLKAAGISDYSIWFDPETNTLFATLIRSTDHGIDRLPAEPVMRRWWEYMGDIMATNPDGSPVTRPLAPMFHLP